MFDGTGEMAALMRAKNWSETSLGPSGRWPQSLRTAVRILLTSRHQMWLGWGPELNFFYNDAYRPTLGAKHPRALGAPTNTVWNEIWTDIGPRIDRVLRGGQATWDEGLLLFLERRGYPEETYHTFSYSPLPDDSGAIGGLLCVVTEDTEKAISERRLALMRELASRLASVNRTADVLAAVEHCLEGDARDAPFCLMYVLDDAAREARLVLRTGITADHPASVAALNLDAGESIWPVERVVRDGAATMIDLPAHVWPRGPWERASTQAIVVPIAQQGQARPAGVFIAGVNPHRPFDEEYRSFISLLVGQIAAGLANARAYEDERTRAEALAEIDRAKTAFFSNISHEFRTPLTLMLGPTEDALASPQRALADAGLETLYRNELRLLKLVNALLDFSRIEAGRLRAAYEPTDLRQVTLELAGVFRAAVERAGLEYIVACEPLSEPIHVDREMWEKIVLNLLSNALKFTFEGRIEVALRDTGSHAELAVRDTGIGIAGNEMPRLFERFHRIEGARARTQEGSGIGLALVHDLVRLNVGTVGVESVLGEGTTFTVRLQKGTSHLPKDRITAPREQAGSVAGSTAFVEEALRWTPGRESSVLSPLDATAPSEAPRSGEPGATVPGRVLVADDNADMREYLTRLLRQHWTVEAVNDGAEALAAARARPPDLVLSDVMMPGLDGFALLRALRADERTARIPVVMLSARAGEEARIEGLQSGADEYLVKPFSARELIARVNSQLALSRHARERESLLAREQAARLEAELQKRHLFSLFMQAPTLIAVLRGPDHVIDLANPLVCQVWGRECGEVINRPLLEALPELRDQVFKDLLDGVYRTGIPHFGNGTPARLDRRGDGHFETVYFNFVYAPLRNVDGGIEGVFVVASDVTNEVLARDQLDRLREAAESANRAKDDFLAMLGHELRNPLAPILTAVQMMRLRGAEMVEKERAIIERQAKHLVRLVDDLLDVSRVTGGKIAVKKERIEIADVVARAVETVSPLIERNEHYLAIDVAHRGLAVDGDPARLAQVIANVLTNAAKYTPRGGRITVAAARTSDEIAVTVRDTGIGIAPDMLPRIFDLFVQDRQTIDRSQGGLGLGLAIVRSIVELHGGRVSVRSDGVGRGAEFFITLPAATRQEEAAADSGSAAEPAVVTARSNGHHVLVVDDNEDAASTLASALQALGYTTRVAHDGPSGLGAAAVIRPDIALLDIGLPGMDGYELARRLRAAVPASLALVALTGYGQDRDKSQATAAGFDAHLVKPVSIESLEATLSALRESRDSGSKVRNPSASESG